HRSGREPDDDRRRSGHPHLDGDTEAGDLHVQVRSACGLHEGLLYRQVKLRQAHKASEFQALHAADAFVIPNPWDAGSARVLAALGFRALATTSSGFAFTLGRLDGQATLDEVVEHAAALDQATDVPLSVDLENGYGPGPEPAALAIP